MINLIEITEQILVKTLTIQKTKSNLRTELLQLLLPHPPSQEAKDIVKESSKILHFSTVKPKFKLIT